MIDIETQTICKKDGHLFLRSGHCIWCGDEAPEELRGQFYKEKVKENDD